MREAIQYNQRQSEACAEAEEAVEHLMREAIQYNQRQSEAEEAVEHIVECEIRLELLLLEAERVLRQALRPTYMYR